MHLGQGDYSKYLTTGTTGTPARMGGETGSGAEGERSVVPQLVGNPGHSPTCLPRPLPAVETICRSDEHSPGPPLPGSAHSPTVVSSVV